MKRPHVEKSSSLTTDPSTEDGQKVPKSFVIRSGDLSRAASQLVQDLRRVMEPNTASRLKERRSNKLKDYMAIAGPLGVTHFLLISQTQETLNLRIARFPKGPTIFFRIMSYSLNRDILASQLCPKSFGSEFTTSPLLVLNNFDHTSLSDAGAANSSGPSFLTTSESASRLLCSVLQNLFPTMNPSRLKLSEIRRVVLFHYDRDAGTIEFRHYAITTKMVGLSKTVKKIIRAKVPDLKDYVDIGDYILREANASDSEVEEDSLVTIDQDSFSKARERQNKRSSQRSVNLVEIGPRMQLCLIKITDGICDGKVLYHISAPSDKT